MFASFITITQSRRSAQAMTAFLSACFLGMVLCSGDLLFAGPAPVILAFGDSLTAGYGVSEEEAYPALLQEILRKNGHPHRVVNGGASGDTTAGGLRRIRWLMKQNPSIVIVELGANDGLRGLSVADMEANLAGIIEICQKAGAKVLLAGMKIPPNYGEEYAHDFESSYLRLAKRFNLPLMPFFLDGVAGRRNLTQGDGLHPLAPGYEIVADNVWKHLRPLL